MAKVIRAFRERYHDMKRYNVGDDYPETDKGRVKFLVREGYLEEPEETFDSSDINPNAVPQKTPTGKRRKKGADADGDFDA